MASKQSPAKTIATAVKGAVVRNGKRNFRILVGKRVAAVVWQRGNGNVVVYANKATKPSGALKSATESTTEGIRLRIPKADVEDGKFEQAVELVRLAAEAVAPKPQTAR